MVKIVDLSHPIEDGMITYTGLPGPNITDHLSREGSQGHYAQGTTFQIGKIEMVANTDGRRPVHTILLAAKFPLSSTCAIWAVCRRLDLGFSRCRRQ
jgi:hypothetical protein